MVTRITPHTAPKVATYSPFAAGHLNTFPTVTASTKSKLVLPITQESFLNLVAAVLDPTGGIDPSVCRMYSDYLVFVNPDMMPQETHILAYALEQDEIANISEDAVDNLEWCRYSEITLRVAAL
ncbi:hypothetical protein VH22019_00048 [Vibrio phage VH2_2019]|nr:hypothetical protein VH22019_00048 [Vibrio phage VH2_2019]